DRNVTGVQTCALPIWLESPFEGNEAAWMVVSPDKSRAVAAFYQKLNKVNGSWLRLKLAGLDADSRYRVCCDMSAARGADALDERSEERRVGRGGGGAR